MRLLHKATKQFTWIYEPSELAYVIISHRWFGTETTQQEFERQRDLPAEQWSAGVRKVMQACHQAEQYPEDYIWIDTCCIDKTNNVELSETINSMFDWYRQAACCLVYLDDVLEKQDLASSSWWTRGWTLQELLAPQQEIFFTSQWVPLGSRGDLAGDITAITSIDAACFGNQDVILQRPVAERMSWLSDRTTSRKEDMAYCMLGIFGIVMPMLYGEGARAFLRLQKEIFHEIDDDTIFLWLSEQTDNDNEEDECEPMFAPHASGFRACKGKKLEIDIFFHRTTMGLTRRGLEVETCGRREDCFADTLSLLLNCTIGGRRPSIPLVKRKGKIADGNNWRRQKSQEWTLHNRDDYNVPQTTESRFREERQARLDARHQPPSRSQDIARQMQYEHEIIAFSIFIS